MYDSPIVRKNSIRSLPDPILRYPRINSTRTNICISEFQDSEIHTQLNYVTSRSEWYSKKDTTLNCKEESWSKREIAISNTCFNGFSMELFHASNTLRSLVPNQYHPSGLLRPSLSFFVQILD